MVTTMTKGIIKKPFITIAYIISFLQFANNAEAVTATTIATIQGNKPRLATTVEDNFDNFELFGLTVDDKNYYGDDALNIPVSVSYPFKDRFKIAPIKQPDADQYLDIDGDELSALTLKDNTTLTWYYTDSNNKLVQFTPKNTDTFCSIAKDGKIGPYKVKISSNLLLLSKYGDPNVNEYPNEQVITQPSKTYTVLNHAGICFARPELKPTAAANSALNHWDKRNGFLIQSNIDINKNFPTTAFYGAKFDLLLTKNGLRDQYDWEIIKGQELVTLSLNTKDVVTISFNTPNAMDPETAWNYVMNSNNGFTVLIQGKHKITEQIIDYGFVITKWFSGWDKNIIGQPKGNVGTRNQIVDGCDSLGKPGSYRISYANEVSNARMGEFAGDVTFTREIGTLLGEWGAPSQTAYPNSWAAATNQDNLHRRYWLWDTVANKYCDLHSYDAKYHCRGAGERKNGICTAIK